MPATALYASLLALLLVYLGVRTIRLRQALGVGLGDGGKPTLTRAMRTHANFAEYVPTALLLIYLVEVTGGSPWWVHTLGILLVVARLVHAWGFGGEPEKFNGRVAGAGMTLAVLVIAALRLLWVWVPTAM
jgi:uncharacterized membrane protein YecN with MAPEG domain